MISVVSTEATTVEDSGRLVSARFISKNGGEFAELYSTGDGNSTNEVTHDRRYGRTLLENIEAVVYRYLCPDRNLA